MCLIIYIRLKALPDAAYHVMDFCITEKCSWLKHRTYCVFFCFLGQLFLFSLCGKKQGIGACLGEGGKQQWLLEWNLLLEISMVLGKQDKKQALLWLEDVFLWLIPPIKCVNLGT